MWIDAVPRARDFEAIDDIGQAGEAPHCASSDDLGPEQVSGTNKLMVSDYRSEKRSIDRPEDQLRK